jgi:hypothetical protein
MPETDGENVIENEDTTAESPDVPLSSMDLAPTSPHTRAEHLSHDYALVCDNQKETGSLYTKFCSNSPLKCYCTSQGQVKYSDDDTLCDHFCSCEQLASASCFIHPFLRSPVCSDVETGEITDMKTGAVVGYPDSNGTEVYSTPNNSTELPPVNTTEENTSENPFDDSLPVDSTDLAPVNKTLTKRHDFVLICGDAKDSPASLSRYCSNAPYKYSCTANGRLQNVQFNHFCNNYCKCGDFGKSCFVPIRGPIQCSDVVNTTEKSIEINIPSSTDLVQVNDTLVKRHDYTLVCESQGFGTTQYYSRRCAAAPFKYYCNEAGRVKKGGDWDSICQDYCTCQNVTGKICYVSPYIRISPVCADVQTGEITDQDTGAIVGQLGSNWTAVYYGNVTTTGQNETESINGEPQ